MTDAATRYELQIEHPLLVNEVPIGHYDSMREAWKALPWWRRLFTRQPFEQRPGHIDRITVDVQHLDGRYASLDAAVAAAERIAEERTGQLHPWACVAVVAVTGSDRQVVDGIYPGGGGHI